MGKKTKADEKGAAHILVLIVLLVGSLIITPLLSHMTTGLRAGLMYERKMYELYAADAGVEDALRQIITNTPGLPRDGDAPWLYDMGQINSKGVSVSIEYIDTHTAEITYVTYKITSTATTDSDSNTTLECYAKIGRSPFGAALIATESGVKLENTTVYGSVWAIGEVESEDSTVTGEIRENYSEDYPLLDTGWYETEARGEEDIYVHEGDLVLGAGDHDLGPIYITGYLKIEEGANVQLGGIVYVVGETQMGTRAIHIEAGATITGNGTENSTALIAQLGNIKIELCTFEVEPIPLVWAVVGDIERIESNQYITAILYVPEGNITLEQNVEIYGSVFGQTVGTVQYCTITYAGADESDFISDGLTIQTWEIGSQTG